MSKNNLEIYVAICEALLSRVVERTRGIVVTEAEPRSGKGPSDNQTLRDNKRRTEKKDALNPWLGKLKIVVSSLCHPRKEVRLLEENDSKERTARLDKRACNGGQKKRGVFKEGWKEGDSAASKVLSSPGRPLTGTGKRK